MRGQMPGCVGREERTGVLIKAALRVAGRELPVTVIDMSEAGCKIRCLHILPIGEIVELVTYASSRRGLGRSASDNNSVNCLICLLASLTPSKK